MDPLDIAPGSSLTILTKPGLLDPCICHNLHRECNPRTCCEAAKDQNTKSQNSSKAIRLSDLKKAKVAGCSCCTTLHDGLTLPKMKAAWQLKDDKNEDQIEINLDPGYVRVGPKGISPPTAGSWRHFSFYREPGFLAASSSCRAFPIPTRLSDNTASETSFKNLKDWLGACEKHEACKRGDAFPTRILDVEVGEIGDARLISEPDSRDRRYTALSYCWGKSTFLTTTTKNLAQRKTCIKWNELPKTFQDAVTITRALGIRYIWIDALCIIQDDSHDWENEAPRMSLVYQNSYLTIAASQASDTNGGCFTSSKGRDFNDSFKIHPTSSVHVRRLFRNDHKEYGHHWAREISPKPLHTRGWALQERLLSPRIVHFTALELVWECNTKVDCQCGGIHVMSPFKPGFSRALVNNSTTIPNTQDWVWIIEVYTLQKVTYELDRLPALSGLVRQAQAAGWGRYAAGLWLHDLAYLMCWGVINREESIRYATYLAPSWSWVSISGAIKYPTRIRQGQQKQVKVLIYLQDLNIKTGKDHTGKVIDGHILVSGLCVDGSISLVANPQRRQVIYRLMTAEGDFYDKFIPDAPIESLWITLGGMQPTELPVKIIPWCFVDRNVSYMILGPARERKNVPDSIERGNAWERWGMITEGYRENESNQVQWYSQATPFENLIFV